MCVYEVGRKVWLVWCAHLKGRGRGANCIAIAWRSLWPPPARAPINECQTLNPPCPPMSARP